MLLPALLLTSHTTAAPTEPPAYSGLESQIRVPIPRIEAVVDVDGALQEEAWRQAVRLTGFSQYAPVDGRAAVSETEVRVWYSPTAIHFGIRAHAAPGSVRATLADRDKIDADDSVQIFLSTFNDGRQAWMFAVNPLGVQADGALVEGSTPRRDTGFASLEADREPTDLSPDFVFDSKGRLTAEGYEVEVRIPFKSLRYQAQERQDWGLHVIRKVQSSGHEDSWVPARRSSASFLAQAGMLAGLSGLRAGLVLDLNPIATAHVDGSRRAAGWRYESGSIPAASRRRWRP